MGIQNIILFIYKKIYVFDTNMTNDHPVKTCIIKDIENLRSTQGNVKEILQLKQNLYGILKSIEILIPQEKRCLWIEK